MLIGKIYKFSKEILKTDITPDLTKGNEIKVCEVIVEKEFKSLN